MPKKDIQPISLPRMRGRWGTDDPLGCPQDQYLEADNVDFWQSDIGHKRGGAEAVGMGTAGAAFSGLISSIWGYIVKKLGSDRKLIGVDATGQFKTRQTGTSSWVDLPTPADAVTGTDHQDITFAPFNGKIFISYKSAVDRLHVWDMPNTTFRRCGIAAASAAPTGADGGGAGAYAAVTRYYKVVFAKISGAGVVQLRSEASATLTATPSGANANYTVTKPASPGDSETHWLLYGSPDNSNFVLLATTVVGTTTYADTTAPSAYSGASIPVAGTFTLIPSCKFMVVDKAGLVLAGTWEALTDSASVTRPSFYRVFWTGTFGSTDNGDDERISITSAIKNYTDVDEPTTGIGGPVGGAIYVFSYKSCWKMIGTSNPAARYLIFKADGVKGCIRHQTIVIAEDEFGAPALYWLSPDGPMRIGEAGQQDLSEDVKDLWATVNHSATNVGHGVYYSEKKQIHWWVATGSSATPDLKLVYDCRLGQATEHGTVRKGWLKHSGEICEAVSSTIFPDSLTTLEGPNRPYMARSSGTVVWKNDTGTDDAGTDFRSTMLTRPYSPWGIGSKGGVIANPTLVAEAQSGVSIQLELIKDFESNSNTKTCLLTPDAAEERVVRDFQDARVAEAEYLQLRLGDAAAADNTWTLDRLIVPVTYEGDL